MIRFAYDMRIKKSALFDVKEEDIVDGHYDVPNGVKVIGDNAFKGIVKLTSINIPNSVKKIGFAAFYGCKGLEFVRLPENTVKIGHSAFSICDKLSTIEVPDSYASKHPETMSRIPYGVTSKVYSK